MALILDGKALAMRIRAKVKDRVAALDSQPGLAVLLVGHDPASHLYVSLKKKACEEAGIKFEQFLYASHESEETIIQKISELNARKDVNGILVQLPLPSQDVARIIETIDPNKDVDGFHPENLKKLRDGKPAIASAVALGIMKLIAQAVEQLSVKPSTAVIVSSAVFAEPLIILLAQRHVNTIVVQQTKNLSQVTLKADILIVAKGIPGLITADMVKPGAIVIDVGTTQTDAGIKGDVDFETVAQVAGAITPTPGGVGPMTVAMLMLNIVKAYEMQRATIDAT